MGLLINQILRKMEQELMDGRLQVGEFKPKVSGCCLAATGKWLCEPEKVENGDEDVWKDIQRIQEKYEEEYRGKEVVYSPEFLDREFTQLTNMHKKQEFKLTSTDLYTEITTQLSNSMYRCHAAIILGHKSGEAHYIGVIIEDEICKFFDANEGFCTINNRITFRRFIEYYVDEKICGLLKQHYTDFQVVLFNWDM